MDSIISVLIAAVGAGTAILIAWYRTRPNVDYSKLIKDYRFELARIRDELVDVKLEVARLQDIIRTNYRDIRNEYDTLINALNKDNDRLRKELERCLERLKE